jgi:hypothetical protein
MHTVLVRKSLGRHPPEKQGRRLENGFNVPLKKVS